MDVPMTFPGTLEERAANYASHHWVTWDEDRRCADCDCKPWHVAAYWPCGQEPPRVEVPTEVGAMDQALRIIEWAIATTPVRALPEEETQDGFVRCDRCGDLVPREHTVHDRHDESILLCTDGWGCSDEVGEVD